MGFRVLLFTTLALVIITFSYEIMSSFSFHILSDWHASEAALQVFVATQVRGIVTSQPVSEATTLLAL